MLEVGVPIDKMGGLTHEEEKTHFALWAIMKSPLIIGADLRKISKESLEILSNKELIAINQDPKTQQAQCFGEEGCNGPIRSYVSTMSNGDKAIVITNFGEMSHNSYFFGLNEINLKLEQGDQAIITDMFDPSYKFVLNHQAEPYFIGEVNSHSSKALKVTVKRANTK